MDDLLKRQNQAGAGGFEHENLQGGDLSGGDGLQPKGLENDIGSGLELERGLERVAAQEAWLNEQTSIPVENWLTRSGLSELRLEGAKETSSLNNFSGEHRSLLVVDESSEQWESLSVSLPVNTDVLVLDSRLDGFDQIKSSLSDASSQGVRYGSVAVVVTSESNKINFGESSLNEGEISAGMSFNSSSFALMKAYVPSSSLHKQRRTTSLSQLKLRCWVRPNLNDKLRLVLR